MNSTKYVTGIPCIITSSSMSGRYYQERQEKIPKGESEAVSRRRTDNTMAKNKKTKDKQRYVKHYTKN